MATNFEQNGQKTELRIWVARVKGIFVVVADQSRNVHPSPPLVVVRRVMGIDCNAKLCIYDAIKKRPWW